MVENKCFYPYKFAAKVETSDEVVGSVRDIALRAGRYGDQFIMGELTLLLEAKIMAARESSKEIKVKLPAPSFLDFILRRQKTVSVNIDAYEVMPNLSESVKFRIFDFSNSLVIDSPAAFYVSKQRILAFLRQLKRK